MKKTGPGAISAAESIDLPIGKAILASNGSGLVSVTFDFEDPALIRKKIIRIAGIDLDYSKLSGDHITATAVEQLKKYFSGSLRSFDVPLQLWGTPFQIAVYMAMLDIPFGKTESYGSIARRIGSPKASRAVGMACGSNPIPVIVPCHRIIGSDGSLTGFGLGLDVKQRLLGLEQLI